MNEPHPSARRVVLWSTVIAVLVGWTVLAGWAVAIGWFAAADTRCGVHTADPQVDMTGGWIVIGAALLWVVPFVAGAAWFRNPVWIMLASASITMSALVVIYMFATPSAFCM
ncbi:hypothetical protein [Luteipulveratus halotolerans]|uniref:Uncharacterized protein n=1 Tax=Luteipulveratus halotolerans TaxID=1631356 RepID=A0A0L6CJR5_9MICO|nr:hypothetical protein [Luteipulveratus halotolerans]KNX38036.1 hypothetical protein VV01_14195 [Luteipulveratus halotolerans]